jgi:hypothetical protein
MDRPFLAGYRVKGVLRVCKGLVNVRWRDSGWAGIADFYQTFQGGFSCQIFSRSKVSFMVFMDCQKP